MGQPGNFQSTHTQDENDLILNFPYSYTVKNIFSFLPVGIQEIVIWKFDNELICEQSDWGGIINPS